MRLNTLAPAEGSRPSAVRLGRGIGSTLGKTCGKGHKGQKARAGGYHKVGFEGGQMPLQRRLPKVGFNSPIRARVAEIRLDAIAGIEGEVTLQVLLECGLIPARTKKAKIILAGSLEKAVVIGSDVAVTAGAKAAIEKNGGKVGA